MCVRGRWSRRWSATAFTIARLRREIDAWSSAWTTPSASLGNFAEAGELVQAPSPRGRGGGTPERTEGAARSLELLLPGDAPARGGRPALVGPGASCVRRASASSRPRVLAEGAAETRELGERAVEVEAVLGFRLARERVEGRGGLSGSSSRAFSVGGQAEGWHGHLARRSSSGRRAGGAHARGRAVARDDGGGRSGFKDGDAIATTEAGDLVARRGEPVRRLRAAAVSCWMPGSPWGTFSERTRRRE